MSTKKQKPSPALAVALATIPGTFRTKLITAYTALKKNASESRHEAAGLAAGKYCEVSLRFLQDKILGSYVPFGAEIKNFADECRKLITAPKTSGNESERVVIPRALVFLYTMRSKRGIGHLGGDVDANAIDIATMARTADWVMCEFIRLYHGLSLEEAQDLVDAISVRQLPMIWQVAGKKRVLEDGVATRDQVLLLLYGDQNSAVLLEDLCDWVEYSNPSKFRDDIVLKLHKERFLEFDRESESVTLSPKGAQYVETSLL